MIRAKRDFDLEVFAANVKRLRIQKGLTQFQLATLSDCSENMISQIERGKKRPSMLLAAIIAGHLGTTVEKLFKK